MATQLGGPGASSMPFKPNTSTIGGSFEYYACMEGMPKGPQTLPELASYPKQLFKQIFSKEDGSSMRRRRFEALIQHGVMLHTDFTGKGSVETTFRIMEWASKDGGGHTSKLFHANAAIHGETPFLCGNSVAQTKTSRGKQLSVAGSVVRLLPMASLQTLLCRRTCAT